jgi:hypothetical protein
MGLPQVARSFNGACCTFFVEKGFGGIEEAGLSHERRMVFPAVMEWYYKDLQGVDIGKMEAYFDRSEKFMRHVEPDWRSPQIRKRHPHWELVNSITQATMEGTVALQIADVIAWGRNHLTAGSHWETDPHYATAVRACTSLQGKHFVIDKTVLAAHLLGPLKEEGFAAIDPQRKAREEAEFKMQASEEFKCFDKMMRELMHVSHSEVKKNWMKKKRPKN